MRERSRQAESFGVDIRFVLKVFEREQRKIEKIARPAGWIENPEIF